MSLCTGVCEGRISVELVELELPRGLLSVVTLTAAALIQVIVFETSRIQVIYSGMAHDIIIY